MPFKVRGFLGFGRDLGAILPTSLPELPIQLRDLRNNQKSSKTNFFPNRSLLLRVLIGVQRGGTQKHTQSVKRSAPSAGPESRKLF